VLLADIEKNLAHGNADYQTLMSGPPPSFNQTFPAEGAKPIATTAPPPSKCEMRRRGDDTSDSPDNADSADADGSASGS
jgi:hypothetical protein